MSYVVYTSSHHTVALAHRKTTPLGWFASWCLRKAAGTSVKTPVTFLVGDSLVGRLAGVITLTLILGALFDLSLRVLPGHPTAFASALVGALAGAGGQGGGAAVVGFLWAWAAGKIADAIVGDLTSSNLKAVGTVGSWLVGAALGFVAAKVTERAFNRMASKSSRRKRFLERLVITLILGSFGVFALYGGRWILGDRIGDVSAAFSAMLVSLGRWSPVILAWAIAIGPPAVAVMRWFESQSRISMDYFRRSFDPLSDRYSRYGTFAMPTFYHWKPFSSYLLEHYRLRWIVLWIVWCAVAVLVTLEFFLPHAWAPSAISFSTILTSARELRYSLTDPGAILGGALRDGSVGWGRGLLSIFLCLEPSQQATLLRPLSLIAGPALLRVGRFRGFIL